MGGEESRQSHRSQAPSTTQRKMRAECLREEETLVLSIWESSALQPSLQTKKPTQQQIVGPVLKERKEKEKNEQKGRMKEFYSDQTMKRL